MKGSADLRAGAFEWTTRLLVGRYPQFVRDHTSILAWQLSRGVARSVYQLSLRYWTPPAGAAFSQLHRSALSVPLNIAEGYVWRPGRRWVYHLRVALGSAVETTDSLDFMLDVGAIPRDQMTDVLVSSRRSQSLILGLIRSASK